MAKFQIMKSIDQGIMDQIDQAKETPGVQKLIEKYNILEDHEQRIANYILMAIPLIVPLMMILGFFIYSSSVKTELNEKEEIIEKVSKIIAKKAQMRSYTTRVFGKGVNNNGAFKNKVTQVATRKGIDSGKIQVLDFDSIENYGVNHMQAKLVFKGFSDKNLFDLMNGLFVSERFQVDNLNIEKNKGTNLLDGNFEISYYNKQDGDK